jgi:uncharacterized coiled-coil protein SlyX
MEKKKLKRSIPISTADGQEQALQELNKKIVQTKLEPDTEKLARQVKRLNMDIPSDLYEQIEEEIDENGQTVKGFFVMLARQYFRNK